MQHQYRQKTKIKHADLPDLEQDTSSSKIECPSCSTPVSATEVNIQQMVGKCTACDSLFSIQAIADSLVSDRDELRADEVSRPEGVEVYHFQDEMEISIKQNQLWNMLLVMTFPIFILIGLLIFFKNGYPWALAMTLVSSAATAYGSWNLLNGHKHRTYVTLSKHAVTIEHRPRNMMKDVIISTTNIEQLFIGTDNTLGGYAIFALVNGANGQKRERILGGITSQVKVKYLEQEMEKYLGIPNKKVIGEVL